MLSNENFEILERYREPEDVVFVRGPNPEFDNFVWTALQVLVGSVVILFAGTILLAIIGWAWSFTKTPEERSQLYEHIQTLGRAGSPARPDGGGSSSNSPNTGRSTTTAAAQTAAQNQVGLENRDKGASSAPLFPKGWHYVQFTTPLTITSRNGYGFLPPNVEVFVSDKKINGMNWVVAKDAAWSGWIETGGLGPLVDIPMHPDFEKARDYVIYYKGVLEDADPE